MALSTGLGTEREVANLGEGVKSAEFVGLGLGLETPESVFLFVGCTFRSGY